LARQPASIFLHQILQYRGGLSMLIPETLPQINCRGHMQPMAEQGSDSLQRNTFSLKNSAGSGPQGMAMTAALAFLVKRY